MHPVAKNRVLGLVCAAVVAWCCLAATLPVLGDDEPSGLQQDTGRRQVELWPPSGDEKPRKKPTKVDINDWEYRAVKSADPRDGVPWVLIAKPIGENAKLLKKGKSDWTSVPLETSSLEAVYGGAKAVKVEQDKNKLPIIRIPKVAWQGLMDADLKQALGIHFHEYLADDLVRLLVTLHRVPPEEPEGKTNTDAESGKRKQGKTVVGTRLEATLLMPIIFSLDQTVAVRIDPQEEDKTESRVQHEYGHAQASQRVLLEVLRGPQDWNPNARTGRRSHIAFYYQRELIGRNWNGYKQGVGKLATLRTTIVLVPPTRWSMLIPLPPDRITQKHIDRFNDMIVGVSKTFPKADEAAQDDYHARYGAYE